MIIDFIKRRFGKEPTPQMDCPICTNKDTVWQSGNTFKCPRCNTVYFSNENTKKAAKLETSSLYGKEEND